MGWHKSALPLSSVEEEKTCLTVRRDVLGRWTTQNTFDAMKIVLTIVDGIGVVVADQRLAIELCS
jgi:hypothetical protein